MVLKASFSSGSCVPNQAWLSDNSPTENALPISQNIGRIWINSKDKNAELDACLFLTEKMKTCFKQLNFNEINGLISQVKEGLETLPGESLTARRLQIEQQLGGCIKRLGQDDYNNFEKSLKESIYRIRNFNENAASKKERCHYYKQIRDQPDAQLVARIFRLASAERVLASNALGIPNEQTIKKWSHKLSKWGRFSQAYEAARLLPLEPRNQCLVRIIKGLSKEGYVKEAKELLPSVSRRYRYEDKPMYNLHQIATKAVAKALIKQRDTQSAEKMVEDAPREEGNYLLSNLIPSCLESEQYTEAAKMARYISEPRMRMGAFSLIYESLREAKRQVNRLEHSSSKNKINDLLNGSDIDLKHKKKLEEVQRRNERDYKFNHLHNLDNSPQRSHSFNSDYPLS